jgi:hypothetical protein
MKESRHIRIYLADDMLVLRAAESRLQGPLLFVGDWNTGAHRLDETGKTFVCAEHLGTLSTLGWRDLWRHPTPE